MGSPVVDAQGREVLRALTSMDRSATSCSVKESLHGWVLAGLLVEGLLCLSPPDSLYQEGEQQCSLRCSALRPLEDQRWPLLSPAAIL